MAVVSFLLMVCFFPSALAAVVVLLWNVYHPNGAARAWEEQEQDTHRDNDLKNQFLQYAERLQTGGPAGHSDLETVQTMATNLGGAVVVTL